MAGKNRANTLSAILSNMTDLEGAYNDALKAEGSAFRENATYLDGIQGRIDLFNNSVQSMWMNFIDSDAIKFVVDLGSSFVKIVDDVGVVNTALIGLLTYLVAIKKHNPIAILKGFGTKIGEKFSDVQNLSATTSLFGGKKGLKTMSMDDFNAGPVKVYAEAVKGLTLEQQKARLAMQGLNQEQIEAVLVENQLIAAKTKNTAVSSTSALATLKEKNVSAAVKLENYMKANSIDQVTVATIKNAVAAGALTKAEGAQIIAALGLKGANTGLASSFKLVGESIKTAFMSNPVGMILTIVTSVISLISVIDTFKESAEDAAKEAISAAQEIKDAFKSASDEFADNMKTVEGLESEFNRLSACVDENGKNISLSTEDYNKYLDIVNTLVSISPDIVSGYDEQGNAIIRKNDAIQKTIELLEKEQQLEAKKYASTDNWNALVEGIEAEIAQTPSKENIPDQFAQKMYDVFMGNIGGSNWIAADAEHEGISGLMNFLTKAGILEDSFADEIETGLSYIPVVGTLSQYISSWAAGDDYKKILSDNMESIIRYLKDNKTDLVGKDLTFETEEQYNSVVGYLQDYYNADNLESVIEMYQDDYTEMLYNAAQIPDEFYDLDSHQKAFMKDFIAAAFPIPTDGDIAGAALEARTSVQELVKQFANEEDLSEIISNGYNLKNGLSIEGGPLDYNAYQEEVKLFIDKINNSGIPEEYKNALLKTFDLSSIAEFSVDDIFSGTVDKIFGNVKLKEALEHTKALLGEEFKQYAESVFSTSDLLYIQANISAEPDSLGLQELQKMLLEHKKATGYLADSVQTYSSIIESIDNFNEILAQTEDVVLNNTAVTQEYKDSLIALGISTEELNECFYENNPLVVKNADALNKLVKSTKTNIAQNAKLAKTQAKLDYYELYKEMQKYIDAQGNVTDEGRKNISALYDQMNALEKVIAKYSRLEIQLLGATNAFEEFEKAQEVDSETDYISSAEEMITALGEAFNTAELGTETAQTAIKGLVPESVYEDLETVDEKIAAIYDYFKDGKLSEYFTIEFDDDGAIESAEMKFGNLQNFIEDGLWGDNNGDGINVFEGADWQHFEFSDKFLDGLEDAEDKLQYFADQMNVTKEVAFAFLKALDDHDIEWLNGDYGSLVDVLVPDTLENKLYESTQAMADLNAQLAAGKITADEYVARMYGMRDEYENAQAQFVEYSHGMNALNQQLADGTISNAEYQQGLSDLNEKYEDTIRLCNEYTELNRKLNNGEITREEYDNILDGGLLNSQNQLMEQAVEDAIAWYEKNEQLKKYKEQLIEYYGLLEENDDSVYAEKMQGIIDDTITEVNYLTQELATLEEPTELTLQIASDELQKDLDAIEAEIGDLVEGEAYKFDIEAGKYTVMLDESDSNYQKVRQFVDYLNKKHVIDAQLGEGTPDALETLQSINTTLTNIQKLLEGKYNLNVDTEDATSNVSKFKTLWDDIKSKSVTMWSNVKETVTRTFSNSDGSSNVTGTAHASGTAHKSGDWGLPANEHNSLVGELGTELVVDPYSGRYYTVGDNGAEMVDLPKGAIIFNHKQTEGLLKNGHITSRGKAYATGNAHSNIFGDLGKSLASSITIYSGGVSKDQYKTSSTKSDSSSDSADEFAEVFDWIEVRLEEINEQLDLMDAKLQNAADFAKKNNIIDEMMGVNETKMNNLIAGIKEYSNYAAKLLIEVPEQYRKAAQDGAIAITEFAGEADEKTVEAIENYREWAQKVAELDQELEATKTTLRELAIQKIDNAYESGSVRADIEASQTEKLQNAVDYDEARGLIASPEYYAAMMENSSKTVEYLTKARDEMQKEFDQAVKDGILERGKDAWYEELNKLYEVDAEIDEAIAELEEFQNAINDIYWDNFDELINRFDYITEDAQSLIDLMDSADMVTKPEGKTYEGGTVKFWSPEDVQWTKEGLATMGLHAQKLELAEEKAKQYGIAIDDLTEDYKAGRYSEIEYREKLAELTKEQYDAIEAAEDEKEAIVDLNEARIDMVKDGLEKEIEAYEELIEKQKEQLDSEKDLYDFQKNTADQQKNIADIERQLAALAYDNSLSAMAKRKQLEAELAEAQYELQDTYYNRSIEDKQNALDTELEAFQTEKEAEIATLEEYLTNVEQVITDSLGLVRENASAIGQTLTDKATEYNLTVSDAVLSPWKDGALAIDEYTTKFGDSISSTVSQLDSQRSQWIEIKNAIDAASKSAEQYAANAEKFHSLETPSVKDINQENKNYAQATPSTTTTSSSSSNKNNNTANSNASSTAKTIKVGGKINAGSAQIYGYFGDKTGERQYFRNDPIYTVLEEKDGYLKVRHHKLSSGVTGFFKKSEVKAYAKGSLGVDKDQVALIDELGLEELVLHAGPDGRLQYLSKGSAVIPHNISENLMKLGQLNPQDILDRNRPAITPNKSIVNNEINISMNVAEVVHIDKVSNDTIPDLTKAVEKQMDSYMQKINGSLRRYTR